MLAQSSGSDVITRAIYVCCCRIFLELSGIRVIVMPDRERSCVSVLEDSLILEGDLLVKSKEFTWISVLLSL